MAAKRTDLGSAELLKSLKAAINNTEEQVPEGWKTTWQLQLEWGLSPAHTGRLIRAGVQKGILEARKFRIQTQRRGVFPTEHYRKK
jgi:hypothetical protein